MLRKFTLALVAAATLGAMALAPTAASAGGGGGGGGFKGCCGGWGGGGGGWGYHHHHHFGPGFGIGFIGGGDDGCYQTRRIMTPFGYRLRTVNVCEY
jgi:hypothetical protein